MKAALNELRDVISEWPTLAHDGDVEALQPRLGQDHVILLKAEAGLAPGPGLLLLVTEVRVRFYVIDCRGDNLSQKMKLSQ